MNEAEYQRWFEAGVRARGHDRGKDRVFAALSARGAARVRRSTALAIAPKGNRFHVTNFLDPCAVQCGRKTLDVLSATEHWTELQALRDQCLDGSMEDDRLLVQLVGFGVLLVEGSEYAAFEARYREVWEWGPNAAWLHFNTRKIEWSTEEEILDYIEDLSAHVDSPPLYLTNEGFDTVIEPPMPGIESGLLETMRRRRSNRVFCPTKPVSLSALTEILCSGMAITEFLEGGPFGTLPLSMTPSGGARNPYEAYVLASNVDGLEPGFYHYAAIDNSLGLVSGAPVPPASRFLSDEAWVDECAAVVFLVANFQRTMWKYKNPKAYNVVSIEAGHIAQNMLLTATEAGLAHYPTAALRCEPLEIALGLDPLRQAPLHSVVLAQPA